MSLMCNSYTSGCSAPSCPTSLSLLRSIFRTRKEECDTNSLRQSSCRCHVRRRAMLQASELWASGAGLQDIHGNQRFGTWFRPGAVVDPWAVVVHPEHTDVANAAVMAPGRLLDCSSYPSGSYIKPLLSATPPVQAYRNRQSPKQEQV